jgi:transposase-like protein
MDVNKMAKDWQEVLFNQTDYVKGIVQKAFQTALVEEFNRFINAKHYERSDERQGQRNGYYKRDLKTRVGSLTLNVCRDRDGKFTPELFEKYQRSEKSLMLGIAQMYFSGVSTRKVNKIMEELCGFGISKSQVSELVKTIDEQLKLWRMRKLLLSYPYMVVDARYEKVRENGHIVSKAFVTVIGISTTGLREIIGCWIINSESYEDWNAVFKELKDRGLRGVKYVVADDNAGLRKALNENFQGIIIQRCQVHFMRNFMSKLAKSDLPEGMKLLQEVFSATTIEEAKEFVKKVSNFLISKKKEKVATWLEENIEETFGVYALPEEHRKKMKSTNMVERFNEELKRRSRVVRIFPDEDSCLRLLGTICWETTEKWSREQYLSMDLWR